MNFNFREDYDVKWIDRIVEIHNLTEMKREDPARVNRAFQKSFAVVSAWLDDKLVGIGRVISDGEMYSSIMIW
jgi:hypothetical protein